MSINLKEYLKRKRTNLKDFILNQEITSYKEVLSYCKRRGCTPPERQEVEIFFKTDQGSVTVNKSFITGSQQFL